MKLKRRDVEISIEATIQAYSVLDAYIYGFALQEKSVPSYLPGIVDLFGIRLPRERQRERRKAAGRWEEAPGPRPQADRAGGDRGSGAQGRGAGRLAVQGL